MATLILLNPQIYQALESVIMNPMIHYFLDLGQIYFIDLLTFITADHLQWTIYVKTNSHVYMCIKKLAQNLSALLIPH